MSLIILYYVRISLGLAQGTCVRPVRDKNTLLLTQLRSHCPGMQRVISGSFNATIARFTSAFSDSPRGFVRGEFRTSRWLAASRSSRGGKEKKRGRLERFNGDPRGPRGAWFTERVRHKAPSKGINAIVTPAFAGVCAGI